MSCILQLMCIQFWQSMVCIFDVFEACVGQDVFSGDYFICDVAPQGLLCCVCFNGWTLIKVSLLSDVAYASHLFCSHESKIQCLCSICIEFFCFLWTHVILISPLTYFSILVTDCNPGIHLYQTLEIAKLALLFCVA